MTESEFQALAETTLAAIEEALDHAAATIDVDVECTRSGNVLEIEFVDKGSKIIVNSQAAMQEIWVAAKSGGFHFKREAGKWIDTRNGSELFAALEKMAQAQSGQHLLLRISS